VPGGLSEEEIVIGGKISSDLHTKLGHQSSVTCGSPWGRKEVQRWIIRKGTRGRGLESVLKDQKKKRGLGVSGEERLLIISRVWDPWMVFFRKRVVDNLFHGLVKKLKKNSKSRGIASS